MYSFQTRVRYSETGANAHLTPCHIIDYFQDCTNFDTLSKLDNYNFFKENQWILASWQIVVNRYPAIGEELTVSTWAHSFKGIQGDRNFTLKDDHGNILAYANSIWTYFNLKEKRPARITEEDLKIYTIEPAFDMEYASRKINIRSIKDQFVHCGTSNVTISQIDTNHHMNNCEYVRVALNHAPIELIPKQIRVEYKSSAMLGDTIEIYQATYKTDASTYHVFSLRDADDNIYANIEFLAQ